MSKHTDKAKALIKWASALSADEVNQFAEKQSIYAAAPELLQALNKLNAIYSDHSRTSYDLVEIRAIIRGAIAKAEAR